MVPGAEGHRKDTGGSSSFNTCSSRLLNRTIKTLGTMLLIIAVCTSCVADVASDLNPFHVWEPVRAADPSQFWSGDMLDEEPLMLEYVESLQMETERLGFLSETESVAFVARSISYGFVGPLRTFAPPLSFSCGQDQDIEECLNDVMQDIVTQVDSVFLGPKSIFPGPGGQSLQVILESPLVDAEINGTYVITFVISLFLGTHDSGVNVFHPYGIGEITLRRSGERWTRIDLRRKADREIDGAVSDISTLLAKVADQHNAQHVEGG